MFVRTVVVWVAVGAALGATPAWPATAPQAQTGQAAASDAAKQYEAIVRTGDELFAEQSYRSAVLSYERAARFAAANKLNIDAAALDAKLARARAGRDGKPIPPAAPAQPGSPSPPDRPTATAPPANPFPRAAAPAQAAAMPPVWVPAPAGTRVPTKEAFDELVRLGDASFESGDYFEAALVRARRAGGVRRPPPHQPEHSRRPASASPAGL